MRQRTQEALDLVWEFIAFVLNALVFLLIGVATSTGELGAALPGIAWGVVAILVGRALVIYGLLGVPARLLSATARTEAIPLGWLHVMFWAGLRGAVAMALALSLPVDFPQRDLVQGIVFGIVLFTLLVQGTTAEMVVRRAGVESHLGTRRIQRDARVPAGAVESRRAAAGDRLQPLGATMPRRRFIFDSPDRFVAEALGEPGRRTFYLQAAQGRRVVTVALEKAQVAVLAERLAELIGEVERRGVDLPTGRMLSRRPVWPSR